LYKHNIPLGIYLPLPTFSPARAGLYFVVLKRLDAGRIANAAGGRERWSAEGAGG